MAEGYGKYGKASLLSTNFRSPFSTAGRIKRSQKISDLAAQFVMRDRLINRFVPVRAAIEFLQLRGRLPRTRSASPSAVTGSQCRRLRPRSIDTAACENQIADHRISEISFQPWNSAESRYQSQAQLRKTKTRHLVRNDQIASERELESAAKREAVHGRMVVKGASSSAFITA